MAVLRILIAPNALKGSLTSREAADAMAEGVSRAAADASIQRLPVADGGDGLVAVLGDALGGEGITRRVTGPLGEPVDATFIYNSGARLAIIEIAAAAGLALLSPNQYDPLSASTAGVGELILAATELGARRIVIGIGGSATNDGGTGMARALGVELTDREHNTLRGNGGALGRIAHIDAGGLDPRLKEIRFQVICDVDNPLLGENGATRVFGAQKGATPAMEEILESGLENLAEVIARDLGKDVGAIPGGGAAGGLGAGLFTFLDAGLHPGAELVLDLLRFEDYLADADLVLTAEGRLDAQTAHGKAPAVVARRASSRGVPCIAVAGDLEMDTDTLLACGFTAAFSLCPGPLPLEQATAHASRYLRQICEHIVNGFIAGRRSRR